jgi:hypothetical protein
VSDGKKRCPDCEQDKTLSEFYAKGTYCKTCTTQRASDNYYRRKLGHDRSDKRSYIRLPRGLYDELATRWPGLVEDFNNE